MLRMYTAGYLICPTCHHGVGRQNFTLQKDVNFAPEQAMKAQKVSNDIDLLFL